MGSEFWDDTLIDKDRGEFPTFKYGLGRSYLLSGRTALDYIIRDAKQTRKLISVYLPSYCCHTMIQPFISNGVHVRFYDVTVDSRDGLKVDISDIKNCDAVYVMKYFGYEHDISPIIDVAKRNNKLIIEDATHSFFCRETFSSEADYAYVSFRKWAFLSGAALAIKTRDTFDLPAPELTNTDYVRLCVEAGRKKADYILRGQGGKDIFLTEFDKAEKMLDNDYSDYTADKEALSRLACIDVDVLKTRRQKNARRILEGLKDISVAEPLFRNIDEDDCPLCVPILVKNGLRDVLRKYLTSKNIYCPVHWLLSDSHRISEKAKELYSAELSLICDQRYGTDEMASIIQEIQNFCKLSM